MVLLLLMAYGWERLESEKQISGPELIFWQQSDHQQQLKLQNERF